MKILQTKGGKTYDLTEQQAEKIHGASIDGSLPGVWVGGDYINFYEITSITEQHNHKNDYPQLPAGSFQKAVNGKEAALRGLRKVKPHATLKDLTSLKIGIHKVKYETDEYSNGYEKAKAAGVF